MPDAISLVRLPDPGLAPGYRDSLSTRSRFGVQDFGAGIVAVAPIEGAGAVAQHFELTKLCDASTDLTDAATWAPLRDHPPRRRTDLDDPALYRDRLLARGKEIVEQNPRTEAEIVAFTLAALAASQTGELHELMKTNLPPLFDRFPDGTLWYVTVSDTLLARLAFGRAQLAFQLTPDLPLGEEMEQLRSFSELTLTRGIDMSEVMTIPLLAFSPAVFGIIVPAVPHILLFCFGTGIELRRPYPTSLSALYRPRVLGDPEGLNRSAVLGSLDPSDGERLLEWWVGQLNALYSHATDPTRFTDDAGYHDAAAQTAWMITLERLIGDAASLLSEPQATDLDRVQIAFDLLDKAETLLGYGRKRSGKGFKALLRKGQSVRRLRDAFGSLPPDMAQRLGDEVERLFDELYAEVLDNTLAFRRSGKGARIATGTAGNLRSMDSDTLVASLCRAVRNSSHGLLEILREDDDRFLLAANTGGIPAELPALAPLIALGLLSDADGLIDGSWKRKLVGAP